MNRRTIAAGLRRLSQIIIVAQLVALLACGRTKTGDSPKVRLGQEWFPNSNYAGALFASHDFAPQRGFNIEIVPGSETADPVKSVLTGDFDFGDAAADKVLAAVDRGEPLVVIGVLNINSPTCFIARAEKNIHTPKDFEGKRIGVLDGTATEYVYRTLVAKQQLDPRKLQEIQIPFDLATFVAGQYDVRPAFIYDEPVSLDLKGIKYTLIRPENYGVKFLGTVYFTTRAKVERDPATVQKFVNAVADGWIAALKYPDRAIALLKEYDKTIDEKRERLSLEKAREYFQGKHGKVLLSDFSDWDEMVQSLQELKVIRSVDLRTAVNFEFVNEYHRQWREQNTQ